ncbi:response regulator receiver protein [Calothrix sp. PCC 7716]|nr:response regulator receiver protein [Calothrix sp. PCC 7716]
MPNIFSTQYFNKKRILVVDNVTDHSELLVYILKTEGYSVKTANCGYSAIAKIEASPPDLVLLDLMMPGINGLDVAKWVRQNRPSVAVVLVTSDYELLEELSAQAPIDGFLPKPVNWEKTISTVQAVLASKKQLEKLSYKKEA